MGLLDWIIFLYDDDYLSPDTLETFIELIKTNPTQKWFVTNRAYKNGEAITKFPKNNMKYSYAWKYLILKICRGDATHCIETKQINSIRFSKNIKQGDEWIFFYQLGLKERMYYHDHNSTITDGYDKNSGLNFRKRNFSKQVEILSILFYDGINLRLIFHPTYLIYIIFRLFRAIIKG